MSSKYWTRRFVPASDNRPNNHPLPFNDHIIIPEGTNRNDPNAPCYKVEVSTHTIREIHHFGSPYTMKQIQTILRSGKDVPTFKVQCYPSLLTIRRNPGYFFGQAADYVCFIVLQYAKDRYSVARQELAAVEEEYMMEKEGSGQFDHYAQLVAQARVKHDFCLDHLAMVRLVVNCINVEIRFAQETQMLHLQAQKRKRSD